MTTTAIAIKLKLLLIVLTLFLMKCYPYHYHHTRILYSNKKHITSSSSLTSSSLTSLSSSLLLENYNIDTDYDSIDNDNNFEQFLQALIIYKNI